MATVSDTSVDIAERHRQRLRRLTIAERAELITELCEATTAMTLAGIARQHPDATVAQRRNLLTARRYGREFAEAASPAASS